MSKKDDFGLVFYKSRDERLGRVRHLIMPENVQYSDLSFIDRPIEVDLCVRLRTEISKALNSQPYRIISADAWEDMDIDIDPPDFKVNDLTISLADMKTLLDEWIAFVNS